MRRGFLAGVLAGAALLAAAAPAGAAAPANCPGTADTSFGPPTEFIGEFDTSLQGAYVQIPFDVPAGTTAIRVRYCYDQPDIRPVIGSVPGVGGAIPITPSNTLDLGIYEPPGQNGSYDISELRGWSGGAVGDATVAVNGFSSEATYLANRKAHVHGRTTRAYRPGAIPAGQWAVELGLASITPQTQGDADGKVAYRVQVQTTTSADFANDPYTPVPYDASAKRSGPAWYAGDLHVHGEQEPGNATMTQTFDYAFKPLGQGAGLDFVTLVDHNNTVAYGEIGRHQSNPAYADNLIARGTEVTTYRGHLQNQASGITAEYRAGPVYVRNADGTLTQVRGATPPRDIFDQIHNAGGWTQINHPTIFPSAVPGFASFCRGCPWDYSDAETDYSKVDAIEVQTGPAGLKQDPQPGPNPFTPLALQFYEDALDSGAHIAAVGSSDSHQAGSTGDAVNSVTTSPIGAATTMVFADELSEDGVDRAIKADRTYVKLFGNDGPDLRFEAVVPGASGPPAIIGDTVEGNAQFTARVTGAGPGATRPGAYTLFVFRDGEPVLSFPIASDDASFSFPSLGPARYRLQLQRLASGAAAIEAVSSPIWVQPARGAGAGGASVGALANFPIGRLGRCVNPVLGSNRNERLRGTAAGDLIAAVGGNDRLGGRGGADCLYGGRGEDVLRGGPGRDALRGGAGDDVIDVHGGGRDRVGCGRGDDRVLAGPADRLRRCETVLRP